MSGDFDAILALQGIGWLTRKGIKIATVTLSAKQYTEAGIVHIDIDQVATGGIGATTEKRILDWSENPHTDVLFGTVRGRCRWVPDLAAGESGEGAGVKLDPYLVEGWNLAASEPGEYLQSWVINDKGGWTAEQIWGFSEVDGKRYHTRRVVVKKGSTTKTATLYYDWQGKK